MTINEMHIALRLELDKSDSLNNLSFEPEEFDYWINKAIKRFVKTRYSGMNYKGESFEETQKRTDDLRQVVAFDILQVSPCTSLYKNSFCAELPDDYWFTISEEVEIVYNPFPANLFNVVESGDLQLGKYYMVMVDQINHGGAVYSPGDIFMAEDEEYVPEWFETEPYVVLLTNKLQGVTQINSDTYREHLDNPYSEHRLYYGDAKPLRLFRTVVDEAVERHNAVLISDGNYIVTAYFLTYIRKPEEVSLSSEIDCDLSDHAHDEIIDLTVLMMLEHIESNRVQSKAAMSINE